MSARAAFPGANGKIAFDVQHPGSIGGAVVIHTINPDGSAETALPLNDCIPVPGSHICEPSNFHPVWSPDGLKLLYGALWSARGGFGRSILSVMSADGSNKAPIGGTAAPLTMADSKPTWSQDQRRVAFVESFDPNVLSDGADIYVSTADGSGEVNLTHNTAPAQAFEPAWSPLGDKIAFAFCQPPELFAPCQSEIYLMNPDGSGRTQLTHGPGSKSHPSWSPDGRQIAFTNSARPPSTGDGLSAWYFNSPVFDPAFVALVRTDPIVNFDFGTGSPGPGVGSDNFSVRWTGFVKPLYSETYRFYTLSDDGVRLWVNGQLLVDNWTVHQPTENSGTITLTAGQLYSVELDYFDHTGGAVARLSWSSPSQAKQVIPQSQLYSSTPGSEIGVIDADGSNQRDLANNAPADDYDPAWSPDGRQIAFGSLRDGASNIYVMNTDGSRQTKVTNHTQDPEFTGARLISGPDWQPLPASGGNGSPAVTESNFTGPGIGGISAITTGPDGALWFICCNNLIGRMTTNGAFSTYTPPGHHNPPRDPLS